MPFKPGQSGNPAGRKAKTDAEREVEALARKHGRSAIKRLSEWMKSDNAKASVSAATALLDRGYGKPKQAIIGGGENDPPIRAVTRIELVDLK